MADDLDDEWWSTDGNNVKGEASDSGAENQLEPATEVVKKKSKGKITEKKKPKTKTGKPDEKAKPEKRKAIEATELVEEAPQNDVPKKKRRKRKLKADEIAAKPLEALSPDMLVTSLNKHYKDKLSTIEWDELKLDTAAHFCECNDMTHNPVSYLNSVFPKWAKTIKTEDKLKTGSPILLIITQAALRATQLNREITSFKGDNCKTAKLFAKHFKLQDQTKFLSKNPVHLGIGTPQRIEALLENGGLSLARVHRVVLDWSWRDVKLRRMVEIPELRAQLFDLHKKHIIPRLKKGDCKLGLM